MSILEWIMQSALLLLLASTIPFALRLERGLAALRRDRAALDASASGFSEAVRQAESTLVKLRTIAEGSGRNLSEQTTFAESIGNDLRDLLERAGPAADRLEGLLRSARPTPGDERSHARELPMAREHAASEPMRSQAERDLLKVLRGGR